MHACMGLSPEMHHVFAYLSPMRLGPHYGMHTRCGWFPAAHEHLVFSAWSSSITFYPTICLNQHLPSEQQLAQHLPSKHVLQDLILYRFMPGFISLPCHTSRLLLPAGVFLAYLSCPEAWPT